LCRPVSRFPPNTAFSEAIFDGRPPPLKSQGPARGERQHHRSSAAAAASAEAAAAEAAAAAKACKAGPRLEDGIKKFE